MRPGVGGCNGASKLAGLKLAGGGRPSHLFLSSCEVLTVAQRYLGETLKGVEVLLEQLEILSL